MTDHTTPEPMTDIDPLRLILRLLDEVDRIRAQLDRAKAAAAWERGQRRSQSSTLGVKIDQLGIARAEHAALAARLADAEQARDEAISVAAANAAAYDEARAQLAATAAERNEYARAAVDAHNAALTAARWDELVAENNQLIEELAEALGIELDPETGGLASHEPATATEAPDPDPSEGTAPTSRPGGTQGPHEAPCLDSPAPLTLAQAATALHDWAGDLDDGANTAWPAGHADVIRGIRAAADWLDARAAYETEVRQRATEPEETPTLADAIAAAAIGGRRAANALAEAMATPSGHEPEEAHEEPPCIPVTVHTYGLTDTARNGLIDRVATAAHALDEDVSCTVGGTCPQCEPPEEAPEPTWRDVIRAMRAEGIHLRPLYDIADWPVDRTWQLIDHHGSELGIVTHETSYAGEEWTLALSYERGPSTRIGAEALQPADVLAAARIAGLIGDTDA